MEVHHHPHVEKKNFKEYFLEFLMIFLAVTMGFFAEQLREFRVDKEKEKTYTETMLKDLQLDTAAYSNYEKNNAEIYSITDSLIVNMKSVERNTHLSKIYFLARILSTKINQFFPNKRAYEQMKSSGQLLLINNRQVADSIGVYYNSLDIIIEYDNTRAQGFTSIWD
jgi:hypothetical protein